ncbi:glycine betaine/L-proline ABC transporter permease ProW [Thiohalocapsa marina]|uniref:Glycine betaine/L-proline ABC transporter permease ProW n=1 Tax=Thiohalocapsa marina TaxID=424902 RepID=A0A5M8FJW4_9GAMM|nr:glycine betaine/L-proline ABC transporter permease ProW [Thiohalocapsa marina]KAA6184016.1 glycine betaine/L-proline ABC transporter permease ProW [Thiohalocapsa marina]
MAEDTNPWAAASPSADNASNPWAAASPSADNASNPWSGADAAPPVPPQAEAQEPAGASNPWGGPDDAATDTAGDWLASSGAGEAEPALDLLHPFQDAVIPVGDWVDSGLDWLVDNFRPVFQAIRWPIDGTLSSIEATLLAVPDVLMILLIGLLAWQAGGRRLGIGAVLSLLTIGLIGAWSEAMVTLALVLTSVFFCLVVGLPTGIWLARSDRAATTIRPVLDAMQTTPAFVYLVPVVMLFGIGNVPGVVVTIIFALPPLIRLTNLGIRQVPSDLVEAARSFGASPRQLLFKVQLPLAMPTIMAGVNQTLMLALSMVVIASMIAVGGLGQMVLRGIGRLDMGLATIGGIGIVLLAIILDRMTQAVGQSDRTKPARHWYLTGPAGVVMRLVGRAES